MLGIKPNTMLITAINRLIEREFLSEEQGARIIDGPLKTYMRKSVSYISSTHILREVKPTSQEISDMRKIATLLSNFSGINVVCPFKQTKEKYDARTNTVLFSFIDRILEILSTKTYYDISKFQELRKAILMSAAIAMRTTEIIRARYIDICFEREIINIPVAKWSKKGREIKFRSIMPRYKDEFLDVLRKPKFIGYNENILFTGQESQYDTKSKVLTKALDDFLKKNDMPKILLKDLRHTCAAYAFNKTGNINAVANLLGHKRLETTYNYYAKSTIESVDYDKIN